MLAKYIEKLKSSAVITYSKSDRLFVLNNKELLNYRTDGALPSLTILDETVQCGEEIVVILKKEAELKLIGWQQKQDMLILEKAKVFIGPMKKKMLGQAYTMFVGVSEDFLPLVVHGDYSFTPDEIKCIVKKDDYTMSNKAKSHKMKSAKGDFNFDIKTKKLSLPSSQFTTGKDLNDLLAFLRGANLV